MPVLASIRQPGAIFENVAAALLLAVPLGSMFLGMGVAASEQSHKTMAFLQALPSTTRRSAAAKLIVAAVTVAVPVAIAVGAAVIWKWLLLDETDFEPVVLARDAASKTWMIENWKFGLLAAGVLSGLSLLIWTAAPGRQSSRRSPPPAPSACSPSPSFWALTRLHFDADTFGLDRPSAHLVSPDHSRAARRRGARAPENSDQTAGWLAVCWPYVLAAVASNAAAAVWFVDAPSAKSRRAPFPCHPAARAAAKPAWLAPPRRSPLSAILWKQMRETLPLAGMGAGVTFAVTLICAAAIRLWPNAPLRANLSKTPSI